MRKIFPVEFVYQVFSLLIAFIIVHAAYVADPQVRDFLQRENPAAARAMAQRFAAALRKGLWHPRRNDIGRELDALLVEVSP